MKRQQRWMGTASALLTVVLTAACGSQAAREETGAATPTPDNQKPVTLTVAASYANTTPEELQRYMIEPMKKKYPSITVKTVNTGESKLADLVAAKDIPDLYLSGVGTVTGDLIPLGLAYDMTDLIANYKFDMNRVQPIFADAIRTGTETAGLIGMTVWNQAFGLIYNKDLFDKFGVAYPTDGMTWGQARDLAVKLTRSDNGVQYYGLWPDNVYRGANQLGLSFADWENGKGVFQTNDWKELFAYWYDLYQVPGYAPKGTNYTNEFNQGRLAMRSGSTSDPQNLLAIPGLNWDVVTYPQNPKAPEAGQRVTGYDLYITSTSPNKDAAFQLISVVMSDDVQREISRHGRVSPLKNPDIQNEFAKGLPEFQSKNMIAFTKPKLAPMPQYKNIPAYKFANDAFDSVLYGGKDINTALREADEILVKAIEAEKNK